MTKLKFLLSLNEKLSGLPQDDVEERLHFYGEMIDDRMEEGLTEEEAVAAVGSVDEIAEQILADIPLTKIAVENIKPKRRFKTWEIVLLIVGSPLWVSLLVAAFAVGLAAYAVLWAAIASLWAVFASVVACAFGGWVAGIGFLIGGNTVTGVAMIGAGFVCAGLSIFFFFGCELATKGIAVLTKKFALWMKKRIVRKEAA